MILKAEIGLDDSFNSPSIIFIFYKHLKFQLIYIYIKMKKISDKKYRF